MRTRVIIMAAGEGKRMKSDRPKVLHKVCGRPMIDWVLDAASSFKDGPPVVIVGAHAEAVKAAIGERAVYALQSPQLGTGHAVMVAKEHIEGFDGYVIVMAGDMPLISGATIEKLAATAEAGRMQALVLSAKVSDSTGYGRIIRREDGSVRAIVEERDASEEQRRIREVNTSVYCFEAKALTQALATLSSNNEQREYYLTDCIAYLSKHGRRVGAMALEDKHEAMGINDRVQLAKAEKRMRKQIVKEHMINGVTVIDPKSTFIEYGVEIGRDTIIYPGNYIERGTKIGSDCILYPNNRIYGSVIGDAVTVESSLIEDSVVGNECKIGPNVHLRPKAQLGVGCRVGNFVEIKNATVDDGAKVSHLSYVGDGSIGKKCNIGCGVVFVNYDGKRKHKTVVNDGAFVGCNVNLVAPVEVGAGAYVAAGSTITDAVPEDGLGIARARQINKQDWAKKRREMDDK